MKGGTFVEFGALDGLITSNSLFFEEELDWTGVLIEANPIEATKLSVNRRNCQVYSCGVGPVTDVLDFLVVKPISGWSGFDKWIEPEHRARIAANVAHDQLETVKVRIRPLAEILSTAKINVPIDYMSVDTEGTEYSILEGFDFNEWPVNVVDVEDNFGRFPLDQLMEAKGFERIARLDINNIYLRKGVKYE